MDTYGNSSVYTESVIDSSSIINENEVILEGYLLKKNTAKFSLRGSNLLRYFKLTKRGHIQYFEAHKDTKPKGTMKLSERSEAVLFQD